MALHGSMVEVRASDLEGVALDWAVANAKTGKVLVFPEGGHFPPEGSVSLNDDDFTLWLNDGEGDSSGGLRPPYGANAAHCSMNISFHSG